VQKSWGKIKAHAGWSSNLASNHESENEIGSGEFWNKERAFSGNQAEHLVVKIRKHRYENEINLLKNENETPIQKKFRERNRDLTFLSKRMASIPKNVWPIWTRFIHWMKNNYSIIQFWIEFRLTIHRCSSSTQQFIQLMSISIDPIDESQHSKPALIWNWQWLHDFRRFSENWKDLAITYLTLENKVQKITSELPQTPGHLIAPIPALIWKNSKSDIRNNSKISDSGFFQNDDLLPQTDS
jgi:hypothetical protein